MTLQRYVYLVSLGWVGGGGSFVYCLCKFNVCRAASCDGFAILAARHRTFVLVVTSLFVLFVFLCTINFFFF